MIHSSNKLCKGVLPQNDIHEIQMQCDKDNNQHPYVIIDKNIILNILHCHGVVATLTIKWLSLQVYSART